MMVVIFLNLSPPNSVGEIRTKYWAKKLKHRKVDCVYTICNQTSKRRSKLRSLYRLYNEIRGVCDHPNKKNITILMSGNPFYYFSLAVILRLQFRRLKIILDYRDPFTLNPRATYSGLKGVLKKVIWYISEFVVNLCASKIIVVNNTCSNLLVGKKLLSTKVHIIENGTLFQRTIPDSDHTIHEIIYAGKFTFDRPLPDLRKYTIFDEATFTFYGVDNLHLPPYIKLCERLSGHDLQLALSRASGFILSVTAHDFESTTKVYDYLYLRKPIYVISSNRVLGAELEKLFKDYLYLAEQEEHDSIFVTKYMPKKNVPEEQYQKLHRSFGFRLLEKIL